MFTEIDLVRLLCRDPSAIADLLEKAKRFAQFGPYRKELPELDYNDIAEDTVLEVLDKLDRGDCITPEELDRTVTRSVWRRAQRRFRELARKHPLDTFGLDLEKEKGVRSNIHAYSAIDYLWPDH